MLFHRSNRQGVGFFSFYSDNVIRRCCKSNCGAPDTIAPYEGRQAYFCSSNQCNGIGAETKLAGEKRNKLLRQTAGKNGPLLFIRRIDQHNVDEHQNCYNNDPAQDDDNNYRAKLIFLLRLCGGRAANMYGEGFQLSHVYGLSQRSGPKLGEVHCIRDQRQLSLRSLFSQI